MTKKIITILILVIVVIAGRFFYEQNGNATEAPVSSILNSTRLALTNNTNPIISSKLSASGITGLNSPKIATNSKSAEISVKEIDPEYAADFSNDRILVGASHNIFVGKVIQQIGTKERGIGAETQFQVQVINNVKGKLNGDVVVDQQGGYIKGVLYMVGGGRGSGDVVSPVKPANSYLLQPGSTYIFATRYNSQENWYTLNPYPTASKLLSTDSGLTTIALQNLASNDLRVQQLEAAYPKEISLSADVSHHNNLNNYEEFSKTKKDSIVQPSVLEASYSSPVASASTQATSTNL